MRGLISDRRLLALGKGARGSSAENAAGVRHGSGRADAACRRTVAREKGEGSDEGEKAAEWPSLSGGSPGNLLLHKRGVRCRNSAKGREAR